MALNRSLRTVLGGLVIAMTLVFLADCSGAAGTPTSQEPAQPTAAELLRGSWRLSEPWTDDDGKLAGMWVKTLTFTKSRLIQATSYVYDGGEPQYSSARSGSWSATDDAVTITWYDNEDEDEVVITSEPIDQEYFLVDVGTELFLQGSDGSVAINEYERYKKTEPVLPPSGSWTGGFENDEGVFVSWTMIIEDSDFLWIDRYDPEMTYETTGTAEVDQDEMFITVNLTKDGEEIGETWRLSYAAGYGDDALAVTPYWDEGTYNEDTGVWTFPNPRFPYGNYWMLMRRDAE